jgi:dTDP-4-dehydrorhamnose 3,5-epimerase
VKVVETTLPGVKRVEPDVFGDARGFFFESYNQPRYAEHGITERFVQDNFSRSRAGILRGLHMQHPHAQGKLVSALEGEVFDVAVDVRVGSPSFGKWTGARLSSDNRHQLYVPPGFVHGFYVLSEHAVVHYKCTEVYHPETELSVLWNDPAIGVQWPLSAGEPVLSDKDRAGLRLAEIPEDRLPRYAP